MLDELVDRPESSAHVPRRRRLVLAVTFGATLALLPWIIVLSATLPETASGGSWRLAWVGFDVMLAGAFGFTGWAVFRRRRLALVLLCVTATLLACDAWFDVCLSWGTGEQDAAIAAAVLGEVPLVLLLGSSAVTLLRRSGEVIDRLRGLGDDPVPLRRQVVVMVPRRRP